MYKIKKREDLTGLRAFIRIYYTYYILPTTYYNY